MADGSGLSDGALAVFAFAAYHQLESGQVVTKVIRQDGKGHQANEAAVAELTERKLVTVEGNDIVFTESGLALFGKAVDGLVSATRDG